VDDQLNVQRAQSGFELRTHGITAPACAGVARLTVQLIEFALQFARITARKHQADVRHQRQMPAHNAAEVSVTTDHHHPERHAILP
jgi:hypothetical protein